MYTTSVVRNHSHSARYCLCTCRWEWSAFVHSQLLLFPVCTHVRQSVLSVNSYMKRHCAQLETVNFWRHRGSFWRLSRTRSTSSVVWCSRCGEAECVRSCLKTPHYSHWFMSTDFCTRLQQLNCSSTILTKNGPIRERCLCLQRKCRGVCLSRSVTSPTNYQHTMLSLLRLTIISQQSNVDQMTKDLNINIRPQHQHACVMLWIVAVKMVWVCKYNEEDVRWGGLVTRKFCRSVRISSYQQSQLDATGRQWMQRWTMFVVAVLVHCHLRLFWLTKLTQLLCRPQRQLVPLFHQTWLQHVLLNVP